MGIPVNCSSCNTAVYMEMGDYAACLAECNKALERRYEVKADYDVVAKVRKCG